MKRNTTGKATITPILPHLMEVTNQEGEIHYRDATTRLINRGVWGKTTPPTPDATVNSYFTTRKDSKGNPLFTRTAVGTYRIRGGAPAYRRFVKQQG